MANSYYEPGAGRASQVRALFTRIAPRYDLVNDLQSFGLHRRWKARLAQLAQPAPGTRALDVCCGTGDLAFALARRGAHVTGLDFTPAMLDVARQRQGGDTPVQFLQGDALALPFPDATFDLVTVGYGLRNLSDWDAGLREMLRVTRPGGRILILDFGKPDFAPWRALYFTYLRLFVPLLGLTCCGNARAYAYILESLRHYPAHRGLQQRMTELRLANIGVETILGGVMSINYATKP